MDDASLDGTSVAPPEAPPDAPPDASSERPSGETPGEPSEPSPDAPSAATGEVSDDVLYEIPEKASRDDEEEGKEGSERDGGPRSGTGRADGAS